MAPKEIVKKKSGKKATSGLSFKCKKCGKKLGSASSYQGHLNLHAGKRPFKCYLCTKAYPTHNSLGKHVRIDHAKAKSRTSSQSVARGPASTKNLPPVATKHQKDSKSSQRFPCGVCGKSLASLATYRSHMDRHARKSRHQCSRCGREYPTAKMLRLHEKAKHEKGSKPQARGDRRHVERPFKCRHCVARFVSAESLRKHQEQTHGPCAVCGRVLSSGVAYRAHMSRHTGQRAFPCGHCSKAFYSAKSQREHERYAHGKTRRGKGLASQSGESLKKQPGKGPSPRPRGRLRGTTSDKQLKCRLCGQGLASTAAYKSHMNKHLGSRPYKCKQCSKSYCHASTLRKHERIKHSLTSKAEKGRALPKADKCQQPSKHTSPAPGRHPQSRRNFCRKCGRVLSGPREYESHMNRHAGIQPYKCSVCGLAYHGIRSLQKHMDLKHGDSSTPQESRRGPRVVQDQARKGRSKREQSKKNQSKREQSKKKLPKKEQVKKEEVSRQQGVLEERRKESPVRDDAASCQLEAKAVEGGKPHGAGSGETAGRSQAEHTGPGSFQCGLCGVVLERYAGYMAHMTLHSSLPSSCGGRGTACPSPAALREHRQSQHHPAPLTQRHASQPFRCAVCGEVLSSAAAHEAHKKLHVNSKPFACALCPKAYSRADSLKKHMRNKHYSPPRTESHRRTKHSRSSQTEPLWTNHLQIDTLVQSKHSNLPSLDHSPTDHTPSDSATTDHTPSDTAQALPTVPGDYTPTPKHTPSQIRQCLSDLNCCFCSHTFRRSSELYWHVFSHRSLQPFACSECHLQHFSAKRIRMHQKGHDAANMAICCSLCWEFQSRRSQTVLNHLLSEHGDQLEQQYGIPVPEDHVELQSAGSAPQKEEENVKSENVDTSCMFEVVEMGGGGEGGKAQVVTFESCGGEEGVGEGWSEEVVPVCGEVQVGDSSSEDSTTTPSKSDTILVKYGGWSVFFFKDV